MDILDEHYAEDDHILVFYNATTNTKWVDGTLSAHYMPISMGKWEVEVNSQGTNGKPIYGLDGKLLKHKIKMHDATKGMTIFLTEWGLHEEEKLNAQC